NQILKGGEYDNVVVDGVSKPSISKDMNDKYSALSAMVKGRRAFSTLLELIESGAPPQDTPLAEVWDDADELANGLYGWTGNIWKKSPYDQVNKLTAHVDSLMEMASSNDILQAFVDVSGRMYAAFNRHGQLNAILSDDAKESVNYLNFIQDENIAFGITDKNEKLVFGITHNGEIFPSHNFSNVPGYAFVVVDPDGKVILAVNDKGNLETFGDKIAPPVIHEVNDNGVLALSEFGEFPLKSGKKISSYKRAVINSKLVLPCRAAGRSNDPVLSLTDNGFCHPKVIYKPGGWNGFQYWMLMTPYWGVIGSRSQYENPTILCSHDGINWEEPDGLVNPIDVPNDGDASYWSDTHLVLNDDGFLYAFYRGNHFEGKNRLYAYKKSRDGINWSEREIIFHTDTSIADSYNRTLSPTWYKHGDGTWACVDILWPSPDALNWPSETKDLSQVFKRTNSLLNAPLSSIGYQDYDPSTQMLNYINRDAFGNETPWHIDEVKVGALHIQLINTGYIGADGGKGLQLAWSVDGWNYTLLPKFKIEGALFYRSCLVPMAVSDKSITLLVYIGKTDGNISLEEIILEIK
ncbi:hypothetical protein A6E13_16190, partial [Aliivibrio fischeri]|uniref:hypothetical protein n=1 Tax=Aliivibrio fischeri TaxID=668 RepID=UPI00080E526E